MNVPVLVVDGVVKLPPEATAPSLLAVRMPPFMRRISRPKLELALPFIMTAASEEMRRESEVCRHESARRANPSFTAQIGVAVIRRVP
jgi:hypothetical protein